MVVLQLHFLYLSNGNCLSQKEQIKLVGAELPGVVDGGVDLDASSSINTVSFSSGCFEVFIIRVDVFYWLLRFRFIVRLLESRKLRNICLPVASKKTKNHNDRRIVLLFSL